MADSKQIALDQLTAYGLVVDQFIVDGKLRRVKTSDDKGSKKSGWYVAHEFELDSGRSVITGRFGNWKLSSDSQAFQFDAKFTDEEKAVFKKQQVAQRVAAEKEKRTRQKQAADKAAKIWPSLPTDGKSDYLVRKKINHFRARFSRGNVVVPVYQGADHLVGLQFIYPDGSKKFLTGTEKQGGYAIIEGDQRIRQLNGVPAIVFVEGYATGCSIRMATGYTVIVCFDAGNIMPVLDKLIPQRPDGEYILAADNDHTKDTNKGLQVAQQVSARYAHIKTVWPEFGPDDTSTDFNDLHVTQGLDAVRDAFSKACAPQVSGEKNDPPDDISRGEPPATPELTADPAWRDEIKRAKNREGKPTVPLPLASNVALIIEHDPVWRGKLAYCDFSYRLIKRESPLADTQAGEWEDADTARLAIWLSRTYGFEPPRQKIADGLITVAQRNRFHPVRDYLTGLKWDGTPRIDHWLEDIYQSTTDAEYLAKVGAYFLIGSVARVMRPGCKMDTVLILEGKQGLRKSTSIAALFGEWFSDAPIPIGEKDAYQNIQGVWCCEMAELDSFNKAESNSAKMFFSQVRDRYRPSYGHCAQDFKRQTVFVGTTNQSEYLKDYSGNRRYWPVKCATVDMAMLKDCRDHYWAEAMHRFKAGENWWPDDASQPIFDAVQDERMQVDPWQYAIDDYLHQTVKEYVTADDMIVSAIGKDMAQVTRADQNRVSPIMKALGWQNVRKRIRVGGNMVPRHVYIKQVNNDDSP